MNKRVKIRKIKPEQTIDSMLQEQLLQRIAFLETKCSDLHEKVHMLMLNRACERGLEVDLKEEGHAISGVDRKNIKEIASVQKTSSRRLVPSISGAHVWDVRFNYIQNDMQHTVRAVVLNRRVS